MKGRENMKGKGNRKGREKDHEPEHIRRRNLDAKEHRALTRATNAGYGFSTPHPSGGTYTYSRLMALFASPPESVASSVDGSVQSSDSEWSLVSNQGVRTDSSLRMKIWAHSAASSSSGHDQAETLTRRVVHRFETSSNRSDRTEPEREPTVKDSWAEWKTKERYRRAMWDYYFGESQHSSSSSGRLSSSSATRLPSSNESQVDSSQNTECIDNREHDDVSLSGTDHYFWKPDEVVVSYTHLTLPTNREV